MGVSRPSKRSLGRVLLYLPIYLLLVGLAATLWSRPGLLAICYALMAGGMLWRWHTRTDLLFFVLAAVLGSLGEATAVRFGAWQYASTATGIPLWLPLAWGIVVLYLKHTTAALVGNYPKRDQGN